MLGRRAAPIAKALVCASGVARIASDAASDEEVPVARAMLGLARELDFAHSSESERDAKLDRVLKSLELCAPGLGESLHGLQLEDLGSIDGLTWPQRLGEIRKLVDGLLVESPPDIVSLREQALAQRREWLTEFMQVGARKFESSEPVFEDLILRASGRSPSEVLPHDLRRLGLLDWGAAFAAALGVTSSPGAELPADFAVLVLAALGVRPSFPEFGRMLLRPPMAQHSGLDKLVEQAMKVAASARYVAPPTLVVTTRDHPAPGQWRTDEAHPALALTWPCLEQLIGRFSQWKAMPMVAIDFTILLLETPENPVEQLRLAESLAPWVPPAVWFGPFNPSRSDLGIYIGEPGDLDDALRRASGEAKM